MVVVGLLMGGGCKDKEGEALAKELGKEWKAVLDELLKRTLDTNIMGIVETE